MVQIVHGVGETSAAMRQRPDSWPDRAFWCAARTTWDTGTRSRTAATAPLPPERVEAGSGRHRPTAPHPGGEKHPGVPYFLLGHSMGSFLTRTYLIDYPGTVDGAILSGTGQEPAPLVAFGKLLAGLECRRLGYDG